MTWLGRSLLDGPHLALVLSDKEFRKALADCGLPHDGTQWIKTDHADATVHWADHKDGSMLCIVAVRMRPGISGVQLAAMLVHEAVHVFQKFCYHIGETQPSEEFEAYAIQNISQRLMQEYADRGGK